MKKSLFLFSAILLFSCSSSSDDDNNSTNSSNSSYHPPAWIQGTWGIKAISPQPQMPMYKFTADNVCQLAQSTSLCWKETIEQSPSILSGSDVSTASSYEANFISEKGSATTTVKFKKVSATKILWINAGSVDVELEKLD